jgi:hypothetical protein
MTLAVMQPYLFPYLGYFQLVHAADTFVFYDDVNFIKNGWVNRNRILMNGAASYLTVQLRDASPFKKINEIRFTDNRPKLLKTIDQAYRKAPCFDAVRPVVEATLTMDTDRLSELAAASVMNISAYLGLDTSFQVSSIAYGSTVGMDRTARILALCRSNGATRYVNAPGGRDLYEKQVFRESGVELSFLKTRATSYVQYANTFVPGLSIIDVLMFNDRVAVRHMLDQYDLI